MGHALAGKLLPESDPVHKVSIIPRGPALGVTAYLPKEDVHSMSKTYIETRVRCLLAGRAAEKIVFDQYTTGASNDLERATALTRKMVKEWGMNDRIGPVNYGNGNQEVFLGRDYGHTREYSEQVAQLIDEEVSRTLNRLADETEHLLRDNLDLLHRLSLALVERETLDSEQLDILISGGTLPSVPESSASSGTPPKPGTASPLSGRQAHGDAENDMPLTPAPSGA
ncbi:MAG: cell division protein FtsH, partial [Candidatus Kapaibacterium sp.]